MIGDFHDYKEKTETKSARYHEAGHSTAARHLAPSAHVVSKLTTPGSGEANITFPHGTTDEIKYRIAVSGFLAEARQEAGKPIDTSLDRIRLLADWIVAELKKGQKAFKLEVPIVGEQVQQAGSNPDDFRWLGDRPPDHKKLVDALVDVSSLIEQEDWRLDIETIAELLLKYRSYDSDQDRFWEEPEIE